MPSFDIVSELDKHEARNAIDQANREVTTRFDFKGCDANFTLSDTSVTLMAETDFQLKQMREILYGKLIKRGIEIGCLEPGEAVVQVKTAKQELLLREGIDKELAKKIIKIIKEKKMKVQAQIQGEQVRVTGKKRDDLQQVMAMLKSEELDMPIQFTNFRD
ncbi:MAG: YajQ family cyclic di-GMP-binding protein [Gammaproteobacteria bacterium]|nr:YajQ family cyclic di-GMP-binding protein [Gammaproteobacteria bacterium]